MGFLKKMMKKINLRGTVKAVMGVASLIPAVGPYVDKAKKFFDKTGLLTKKKNLAIQQNNPYLARQLDTQLQASQKASQEHDEQTYAHNADPAAKGVDWGLILQSAGLGVANYSAGTKDNAAGQAGANILDGTLKVWFKNHAALLMGIVSVLGIGIVLLTRGGRRR
jgi:hypothetical protein